MEFFLDFGEVLKIILSSLDINYNQLAKGINVDPSLISKWANNKRIPPYNSDYIKNISIFISRSITSKQQKQNISKTIDMLYKSKDLIPLELEDKIKSILLIGQSYSIENRKKAKSEIDMKYYKGKNEKLELGSSNLLLANDSNLVVSSCAICNECILSGENKILSSILEVLDKASKINGTHLDPILITLNSNEILFKHNIEFYNYAKKILIEVLNNNWKVIINFLLTDDKKSILKTINFISAFVVYENFKIYYFNKGDLNNKGVDVILVPTIGSIVCLLDYGIPTYSDAFYFKNSKIINMLLSHYYMLVSYSSPLIMNRFYSVNSFFCKIKAENMGNLGNRYFYNKSIDSATIPLSLFNKYLKLLNLNKLEFDKRIKYHKNKIETFESRLQNYSFKSIYLKEDVEDFILCKKSLTVYGHNIPLEDSFYKQDIIEYVNHIIFLLEKYDNYEISIISKKNKNILPSFFFETNGVSSLFVNMYNYIENIELEETKIQKPAFSYLLKEPVLVKAVNEHFLDVWESIPIIYKSKKHIIFWLKSTLNSLEK